MQKRPPLFVSFQIFGNVSGEKNVPGVAAVHHALCGIKAGTGEVGMTVHIYHSAYRTAVNSHSKMYHWVFFEGAADFERAFHWLFGALVKNQSHAVASGNFNQAARSFSLMKLLGRANYLI